MSEKCISQPLIFTGLTSTADTAQPLLHADTAVRRVRARVVSELIIVHATTDP